jgi:hypothetical protein
MFDVIICTKSTGRVKHELLDSYEEAQRCADRWSAKCSRTGNRIYVVMVERRDVPAVRSVESVRTETVAA